MYNIMYDCNIYLSILQYGNYAVTMNRKNIMDISEIIGENLRKIRLERNLSLGQLAEMSSVSKMMLSQIEKGTSNPSINTLWKIADALKVPYTALLERKIEVESVVSGKKLPIQVLDGKQGELRCYYHNTQDRSFELFEMTLLPGGTYESEGHGERTDEYVFVVSGILLMTLTDGEHILRDGDAMSFHSNRTHSYSNSGKKELKLMIINYYR